MSDKLHRYPAALAVGALLLTIGPARLNAEPAADPDKEKPGADIQFKPGKGLVISSGDGRHSLGIYSRAQFLYTLETESGADSEVEHSFQVRRARVKLQGNLFGEHNRYKIELSFSPKDLGLAEDEEHPKRTSFTPLRDWNVFFTYLRDLTPRVGQFKVPYSRQRVISSGDLQLVDRSIVNKEFNLDRDIGIDLHSKDFLGLNLLRYFAYVGIGDGRDSFELGDLGLMYIARIEVLPLGMFHDYFEADLDRYRTPKLSIGAAYAFVDNAKGNRGILGSRPADGGTTDTHNVTADVAFKWYGVSLLSAFMWRDGTRNPGDKLDESGNPIPVEDPRKGWGVQVQAGWLVPRIPLEIAARYGLVRPTGSTSLEDSDELGGALSYYFADHSLKLQLDYFRLWGPGGIGGGNDMVRLQLQAAL